MRKIHAQRADTHPVFVFGISGATWKVIEPLLEDGRLPHLQHLMAGGCWGTMESVRVHGDKHFRPQIAWPTLATGCEPCRHGITHFYHTADDIKVPAIWDMFQQHGLSVGLYGWPVTWPPHKTNGFVIPSHLARDSQTWPPELRSIKALDRWQQEAEREKAVNKHVVEQLNMLMTLRRNGLRPKTFLSLTRILFNLLKSPDSEERALLLRYAKLELSIDFFLKLYAQYTPSLTTFHTFLVDFASHRYWRYFEPEKFPGARSPPKARLTNAVHAAYLRTDRVLGRLIAAMATDSIIAVVSEHGMMAEPESAEVGEWRYVIQGLRLKQFVGLGDEVMAYPVARWVAFRARPGCRLPGDTASRFRNVTVVETDLPLFNVYVHGDHEVIVKLNIPRTIARYRSGDIHNLVLNYNGSQIQFADITRQLGRARSAMHDSEGILILNGPGIRRQGHLPPCRLVDFTPTILRAAGLPLAPDLDGTPFNVFASD